MYEASDPRDYDNAEPADENWTQEDYEMEYDDSMDGDHDSAMTSVGWGTDEDYGYYPDE